jgi:hypothetical protein
MKMRNYFIITSIFLIAFFSSCGNKTIGGNGKVSIKDREVQGFKSISIKGEFDVVLKNGSKESLSVEADENLIGNIISNVSDSNLKIYNVKTVVRSKELKLIICCPELNSIDFSGATELSCDSEIIYKNLNINISGAGRVDMRLQTNELNAVVSGGAELVFRGKSKIFDVSITGAGNIDAQKFEVQDCRIDISGFGRAKINAVKNLEVNISGAGKVEYIGNPEVKQSITGAGKIYKKI